jgi:DNA repair exonuclease SbcCD ATPase subunit
MNVTTNPFESKVTADNPYLQTGLKLSQQIREALENSSEVVEAVAKLKESKAEWQRITEDLEKFSKNKTALEAEIEDLKNNFGSNDSLADLKQLEECELKLKVINTAIPLLDKKVNPNLTPNLSLKIERYEEDLRHQVERALEKIKNERQEEIDAMVDALFQTFSMYSTAMERAQTEQQVIPADLRGIVRLKYILPKMKGEVAGLMDPLEKLAPGFFIANALINKEGTPDGTPGAVTVRPTQTVVTRQLNPSDLKNITNR